MKLGYFVTNQYLAHEPMGEKIKESIDLVKAARDAGFDMVCAGQHYLSAPYQMPATMPFLARLAAEAGDMYVGATVILVPLHNPVELAESVATLDAITNGKFVFGVGLGYREEEYAAFGVRRRERVYRLFEAMDVMRLLWSRDDVEFSGTFYNVPKTTSTIRTTQLPHPPIWVAANRDEAVQRAARMGYPWLINPHATGSLVAIQSELYQRMAARTFRPISRDVPMMREAYIGEDRSSALRESQPYLSGKYESYAQWGQDKALPASQSFSVPFEELARDRFIIGGHEDVVQDIQRYESALGVNWMILRMQWPGMDHASARKQIELMGRHVIPRMNRESPGPVPGA